VGLSVTLGSWLAPGRFTGSPSPSACGSPLQDSDGEKGADTHLDVSDSSKLGGGDCEMERDLIGCRRATIRLYSGTFTQPLDGEQRRIVMGTVRDQCLDEMGDELLDSPRVGLDSVAKPT
jgi:hypothetical protein